MGLAILATLVTNPDQAEEVSRKAADLVEFEYRHLISEFFV